MSNYIVYMHINKINGKRYIGITSQKPSRRWRKGKGYKENERFTNAINKYGWDNFEHIILATDLSEEQAKQMEIELIAKYDTTNKSFGYNITKGGEGGNGRIVSEEERKAISDRQRGENAPNYGKTFSDEWKNNISKTRIEKGIAKGENNPRATKVICLIDSKPFMAFDYIKQASEYFGIKSKSDISKCCRGYAIKNGKKMKVNYCGKDKDGRKLQWKKLETIEL